jgi:hypothetical protein
VEHSYQFFDREAFDPVWRLSWTEFLKKYRTRWASSPEYSPPGECDCASLRGLIGFSLAPDPSPEVIEDILKRRTIRWTLQQSGSSLFMMSEIMLRIPSLRRRALEVTVKCDVDSLVAAAVDAYLSRRASVGALRAVLKLHCVDPGDILRLNRRESTALQLAVPDFLREPIYSWLGPYWLDGQWTNALKVSETRDFVAFVIRAWEGNWPCPRIKDMTREPFSDQSRFRDFSLHKALANNTRRTVLRWQKPCVFREWL